MLDRAENKEILAATKLSLVDCGGAVAIAQASRRIIRHQTFSEYASSKHPDRVVAIDTALEMDRFSEVPHFARLFAKLSGHVLVVVPDVTSSGLLGRAISAALKETSDVFSKLGEAFADDGKVSAEEATPARTEIREAIERLHALDFHLAKIEEEGGE